MYIFERNDISLYYFLQLHKYKMLVIFKKDSLC